MPLPRAVRVLGRTVNIRRRGAKAMPDALGEWHAMESRIDIRIGQLPHDEADAVLHEVMHAVLTNQGREYGGDVEETYVRALATGLLSVLRENPRLTAYLTE